MTGEQLVDLAGHLDASVREKNEVVGDALELSEHMEDSSTETPSSAAAVNTVAMKSCRATGSSIATGSSSTSSRGRRQAPALARAVPAGRPTTRPAFRFSGMPSSSSRLSTYRWSKRRFRLRVRCSMSAADKFS